MKKPSFYPRLAVGNLWRNKTTYGPYLLACVVSIFTFYTMLSINLNGALNGMRGESIVKTFSAIGTIILAIFCGVLIFYTDSFLIKRRKKELGLYSILGMAKKNIAALMFYETLFVTAIALAVGLAIGLLLSQLLFWVLLRMARFPVMVAMPVRFSAIGITAAYFSVIFMLALLRNLMQVHITNPIDLLAGAKQGEKEPKASWLLTLIGLLCLGCGYFLALYFTSPTEVLLFFLGAVVLVIIGTYCLFTSGSVALLKWLRKNKAFYYQPGHFVSVSGMIYRMKQNAAGLATICILSCMVLVTVASTVSLNVGAEDSLRVQNPNEYALRFDETQDADGIEEELAEIAKRCGVSFAGLSDYRTAGALVIEKDGEFTTVSEHENVRDITYVEVLLLEDYNRSEGVKVALREGEALLFVTGGSYGEETLTVNGIQVQVMPIEVFAGRKAGTADVGRSFSIILRDEAAANEILVSGSGARPAWKRTLAFDLEGSEDAKQRFYENYKGYTGNLHTEASVNSRVRRESRTDWYATNGGFLFLGIYFGVLFMLAAALIIYYKQMSEGYDDAVRFEILQKVGLGEEEVKKIIDGQILAMFFLPLGVAILHVSVAFFPVSRAMVLFGVLNVTLLATAGLLTVLAYVLVYLLVYRQTARVYFGVVRRKTSN